MPAENLESIPDFKGLNIPRGKDGKIDPMQELFRTDYPGVTNGENSASFSRREPVPPLEAGFARSIRYPDVFEYLPVKKNPIIVWLVEFQERSMCLNEPVVF